MSTTLTAEPADTRSAWGAVMSMALCVAVLIASEFMPVSLLTPIASELGVTEGQAGQAVSISGLFAVITSLTIAGLTRGVDRKLVQSSFAALLIVSALIVASAPSYPVLMIGRALLGIAIGGFWSMSTAIVMRLLPTEQVPQGLAALNAGNAIAATISALLGAWLGEDAYAAAAEPKELMIIDGADHVDLYDQMDVIPFDRLAEFFGEHLAA